MELDEVKTILRSYYDFPRLIAEEEAIIRTFSNLTDNQASRAIIESCRQRISSYGESLLWYRSALEELCPTDRRILELAYMGPRNVRERAA